MLFICWIPYAIKRYPAGFEYDAYFQVADYIEGTMTAHWPPASSAWMGSFVLVGQNLFGSPEIGIFLYILLQIVIGSAIFSYCAVVMRRLNVPALWTYISVIVYALVPVYPGYIASAVKDGPFAYMVLLLLLFLVQTIFVEAKILYLIAVALTGILMSVLRNNGIFILIGLLIMFGIVGLVKKKIPYLKIALSCLVAIAGVMAYSSLLLPSLGIAATSEAEAFSVPFQQTARLAAMYPECISDEEAEIIDGVLDLEVITEKYEPYLADNVKGTYHNNDIHKLTQYFVVWFKEGIRRPDVYFDAFVLNSIGFIYPDIRLGNSPVVSGVYSQIYNLRSVQFDVSNDQMIQRETFQKNISFLENTPLVFPFVNTALQLWIPVMLLFLAIYRRNPTLIIVLVPSLIGVLVCLASPTYMNNGARYAIPVIYANMLLVGLFLGKKASEVNAHDR